MLVVMIPHEAQYSKNRYAYINKLLEMLNTHALRKTGIGEFADNNPHMVTHGETRKWIDDGVHTIYLCSEFADNVWHFSGNFYRYSYAFSCYTDEPELIKILCEAIEKNKQMEEYINQPDEKTINVYSEIVGEPIKDWVNFLQCPGNKTLE